MIHVYYGYGKGKTSSAIGAGMRAKGAGKSVFFVQFLKDNKSSELSVLPFDVFSAPESVPFNPGPEYKEWVDKALSAVKDCKSDFIILDEFLDVIPNFVSIDDALSLIKKADCEIIITGHKEVKELFEKADYLTFFDKIKHPYDKGVKARKGIEY